MNSGQVRWAGVVAMLGMAALGLVFAQGKPKILTTPKNSKISDLIRKDQTPPPRPPKEATIPANGAIVGWDFIRANHADVFSNIVGRVKTSGEALAELGGLVQNDALKNYRNGANQPSGGATSEPNRIRRPGLGSAVQLRPTTSLAALLRKLEIAPKVVDFGSVVDGQAVRKVIYVRNVPAGVTQATLATKASFRILEVKVLEGRYAFAGERKLADSLILTGSNESAGIGGFGSETRNSILTRPSSITRSGAILSGPNRASAAVKITPSIKALAKRTVANEAPFEVDATEGSTVRFVVEYKPKWNLNGPDFVGKAEANLDLMCGGTPGTVPLRAQFEGVNIGVVPIPESREFTLLASHKTEKHPSGGNQVTVNQHLHFSIPIILLNPKDKQTVGFSGFDLPPGVTLDGDVQSFEASNGKTLVNLPIDVHYRGDGYSGAELGMGQEMIFLMAYGNTRRYLSITLNLLPDIREYSVRGSLDNVYYDISVIARSTGFMDIDYDFHTSNAWPTDAEFKFSIDGVQHAAYNTIWMTDDNRMKAKGTVTLKSDALAAEWERFVQKGGSFWIKVTEKFRLAP